MLNRCDRNFAGYVSVNSSCAHPPRVTLGFGSYLVPAGRAIARILVPGGGDMDCLANLCKQV